MTSFQVGLLRVEVHPNRSALGIAAARAIAPALESASSVLFAAAPSQSETLEALVKYPDIHWSSLTAFHLDEYAGASPGDSYSFRRFLIDRLFSQVAVNRFEGLRAESPNLEAECLRYAAALADNPPVVALLGIGENGHLAFNDPPAARFDDPASVRVVQLTEACRQQQVHDQTFPTLEAVPQAALSVTIPRIMEVPKLFVMVPGSRKAEAVHAALEGSVTEDCPASILRTHPNARLFLDEESSALLSSHR